eukprot:3902976-Amphidinium_carterae.1
MLLALNSDTKNNHMHVRLDSPQSASSRMRDMTTDLSAVATSLCGAGMQTTARPCIHKSDHRANREPPCQVQGGLPTFLGQRSKVIWLRFCTLGLESRPSSTPSNEHKSESSEQAPHDAEHACDSETSEGGASEAQQARAMGHPSTQQQVTAAFVGTIRLLTLLSTSIKIGSFAITRVASMWISWQGAKSVRSLGAYILSGAGRRQSCA